MAYIAGPAPSRWASFGTADVDATEIVTPPRPPPMAPQAELARATAIRRAHPLYASVTLSLLTEIINSRLFTTVRPLPRRTARQASCGLQATRNARSA